MSVDGKEALDENVRYAYHAEEGWKDSDAKNDESSVIRYQYYEANGWSDPDAANDEDASIREEYVNRNNNKLADEVTPDATTTAPIDGGDFVPEHREEAPRERKIKVVSLGKKDDVEEPETRDASDYVSADEVVNGKSNDEIRVDIDDWPPVKEEPAGVVEEKPTEKKGLPLAAKIGIGVGAAVVIGAIATGVVLFVKSRSDCNTSVIDTAD